MALQLSLSVDPASIAIGETSTLTITRSGGDAVSNVIHSVTFDSTLSPLVTQNYATRDTNFLGTGRTVARINCWPSNPSALTWTVNLSNPSTLRFWVYNAPQQASNSNNYTRISVNDTTQLLDYGSPPQLLTSNEGVYYDVALSSGSNVIVFYIQTIGGAGRDLYLDDLQILEESDTTTDPLTITLTSSDTDVATIAGTATILQDQLSVTATITAVADGTSTITAEYGVVSDDITIAVEPDILPVLQKIRADRPISNGAALIYRDKSGNIINLEPIINNNFDEGVSNNRIGNRLQYTSIYS